MSKPLFTNNAQGSLALGITATTTNIQLNAGAGSLFPQPSNIGEYFTLTLVSITDSTYFEIVECIARSGDMLTIVRAQEGTTAKSFNISDSVQLRITAASLNLFAAGGSTGVNATGSSVAEFTATQGQTVFTLPFTYVTGINNLVVFVNGSKQISASNYTESSTTSITFVSGLNAGDLVEVIYNLPLAGGIIDASNVIYNEGGTGAINSTVKTKLQESVSVLDFGAIGNGTTDDTAAIQNAINYVYNSGSAKQLGTVYFPSGSYLVSTINIPYGVELIGAGRYSTFITSTTNATIVNLGVSSSAKTSISHLTIKGDANAAHTSQHGLGYPATVGSGVYDCNFTELEIQNCGGNGINIAIQAGSSAGMFYCNFTDIKCFNNLGYGANFQGGLFNLDTFINCNFSNNGLGGVYYHDMTAGTQEQNFIGCGFEANGNGVASAFGIYVSQAESFLKLDSCFFEGNGIGNAAFDSNGVKIVSPNYLGVVGSTFASHKYDVNVIGLNYDYNYVSIEGTYLFGNSVTPVAVAGLYLDGCKKGLVRLNGVYFDTGKGLVLANDSCVPVFNNQSFTSLSLNNSNNHIANGTFDSTTTGWNPISATLASVAGGVTGNCLQIDTTAANQGASQSVDLTIGRLYKLSYYVKAGTAGSAVNDALIYDLGGTVALYGTSSTVWQQYETTFRAINTSNAFRVLKASAPAGTMLFDNVYITEVAESVLGDIAYSPASTGGMVRTFTENAVSITATSSVNISLNIPSGVRILGVQLRVNTALTAGELWSAAFSGGSTETIATSQAVAKNTKVNFTSTSITTATTNIAITKTGGGSFSAIGAINAIVYYEDFITQASLP